MSTVPLPNAPIFSILKLQLPRIRPTTDERRLPGTSKGKRGAQNTGIHSGGVEEFEDDEGTYLPCD